MSNTEEIAELTEQNKNLRNALSLAAQTMEEHGAIRYLAGVGYDCLYCNAFNREGRPEKHEDYCPLLLVRQAAAPAEASPVQSFESRKDGPYETRQTATELWANIGASVNLRKTRLEMVGGEKEVTA
jgi:hypothetical protein